MAGATSFFIRTFKGDMARVASEGRVIEEGTMGDKDVILGWLGIGGSICNKCFNPGDDSGSAVLLFSVSCPTGRQLLPVTRRDMIAMTAMAPVVVCGAIELANCALR